MDKQLSTEIWHRIHIWMAKNAPAVKETLKDGASEEEIQKLEEWIGTKFPEDFKASYQIHNGSSGASIFDNQGRLLSLDEIRSEWSLNKFVMDEQLKAGEANESANQDATLKIQDKWFDAKWIPFGGIGTGDSIVMDLAPGQAGTVGQVIEWSHDNGPLLWHAASFTKYLQKYADDIFSKGIIFSSHVQGHSIVLHSSGIVIANSYNSSNTASQEMLL